MEILALECSGGITREVRLEITRQECIGQGTFGKVHKALISILKEKNGNTDKSEKNMVAIKQIRQKSHTAQRELNILRQLNHPNIVTLKYYFFAEETVQSFIFSINSPSAT
uniref:Glycogen synthase kinase-3 (Trinotate prediction) n=1 Tax=Myxobolus squamalis TaxID=59785 RepID=A0A6B2FWY3_MYXSQ